MIEKLTVIYWLVFYFLGSYPKRLKRFLFFLFFKDSYSRSLFLLEWVLLFLDLLGIPEILQIFHEMLNWKLRGMTEREINLAFPIFESSICWKNIRLSGINLISKKYHFAFVSFHTVHYYSNISDHILIHELVHIWQYEKFGSAYIIRALAAQRSKAGYDYGGVLSLHMDKPLIQFNFEQMAEIIKDAYLQTGGHAIYNNYIKQLHE